MELETHSPKEIRERSLAELQRGIDHCGTKAVFFKTMGISRQLYYFWRKTSKYGVSPAYVLPLADILGLDASELRIDLYPRLSSP